MARISNDFNRNIIIAHVYGDDGQEEITADSLQAAADIVRGKITPAMLADGGWAVVRDEATMESIEIGTRP